MFEDRLFKGGKSDMDGCLDAHNSCAGAWRGRSIRRRWKSGSLFFDAFCWAGRISRFCGRAAAAARPKLKSRARSAGQCGGCADQDEVSFSAGMRRTEGWAAQQQPYRIGKLRRAPRRPITLGAEPGCTAKFKLPPLGFALWSSNFLICPPALERNIPSYALPPA